MRFGFRPLLSACLCKIKIKWTYWNILCSCSFLDGELVIILYVLLHVCIASFNICALHDSILLMGVVLGQIYIITSQMVYPIGMVSASSLL